MSSLRFSTITIPAAALGGESCLPSIISQKNVQTEKPIEVTEEDEIFWDLGKVPNAMPYRMQSLYTRRRKETTVDTVVLENRYLRAEFVPAMGGKLWSLYDKTAQRELLYVNDCIQPCNLAFRNAWASGGVEWNLGVIAHSPLTFEPLTMARVRTPSGEEVLRFYAFERIREVVYQMDFFLPDDSRVLLCRMRIKNTHPRTIPMYWFSNIAVPKFPNGRLLTPASEAYISDIRGVGLTKVPVNDEGKDITYAENTDAAVDYFFKIADRSRKYIASLDAHGNGMFQTSTSRQKGRKLFVWGEAAGGNSWQKWLTEKAGDYIEIQAGVNRTQYECIPMPPNAAWEWVEAYGTLSLPEKELHGDYRAACAAAEQAIEASVKEEWLETFLHESKTVALQKAEVLAYAPETAWAALENERRTVAGEPLMEPHLDFGEMTAEQAPWKMLAESGRFPCPEPTELPVSYMVSDPWFQLLRQATELPQAPEAENWYAWFHLGLQYFQRGEDAAADSAFQRSIALCENPWAWYGLAASAHRRNETAALENLEKAAPFLKNKIEFLREWVQLLCHYQAYARVREIYETLPDASAADGRVRYYYAYALAASGCPDEAEAILNENGVLIIDDLREGTTPLSDLWLLIEEKKAERDGRTFDPQTAKIPERFDYRMA